MRTKYNTRKKSAYKCDSKTRKYKGSDKTGLGMETVDFRKCSSIQERNLTSYRYIPFNFKNCAI